jgi:hypothetical protein
LKITLFGELSSGPGNRRVPQKEVQRVVRPCPKP